MLAWRQVPTWFVLEALTLTFVRMVQHLKGTGGGSLTSDVLISPSPPQKEHVSVGQRLIIRSQYLSH